MDQWTPKKVAERFFEAANTLRRLPMKGLRPQGYKSSWPEYLSDIIADCGDSPRPIPPSGAAIKRMDECLDWLRWLKPEDAKIVWLRAEGKQWRKIMRQCGICRMTVWSKWMNSIEHVSINLNVSMVCKKNEK